MRIPYDKLWKEMVTAYFPEFVEMFLPDLFLQVNFDIPPKFLEQELHAAIKDKNIKIADKLVQVTLKSGETKWVYIHIEFETAPKPNIGERMYNYFQPMHATYKQDITAIVIYTGDTVPKIHDHYEKKSFGTRLLYEFNTYQVRQQNEDGLIANQNPFAIFVLANLYILKSKNNGEKRLSFKKQVYEIAASRNYSKEKIGKLLIFVLELMRLKPEFQESFNDFINIVENKNKNKMENYITDISRDYANIITKGTFGESFSELKEKAKAQMKETQEKTDVAIVSLYDKSGFTIEQIAETLSVETKYVRKVLRAKDLLKK